MPLFLIYEMLNIKNVSVVSMLGKVIKTGKLNNGTFNVADLADGLYFLSIETEDGTKYSERFLKKK